MTDDDGFLASSIIIIKF